MVGQNGGSETQGMIFRLLVEFVKRVPFDKVVEILISIDNIDINLRYDQQTRRMLPIGVIEIDKYRVHISKVNGIYEFIIADANTKEMVLLTTSGLNNEMLEQDYSGFDENDTITLSNGNHWIGGKLNNEPFGYGKEFDSNENVVYEGFMYKNNRVCYGKDCRDPDNTYKGSYWNGRPWNKSISYNILRDTVYDSEYMNNNNTNDNLCIPISCNKYTIPDNHYNANNITTLYFCPPLHRLRKLIIGNFCMKFVRTIRLEGLPNLESLKIGNDCFSIGNDERDDGICRITNCPKLHTLEIGNGSFEDFKSFKLSNLNSLQSIKFGNFCFEYAEDFSLKGE